MSTTNSNGNSEAPSDEVINEFQIWVVQTQADGAGNHPGSLAMLVAVENGRLVPMSEGSPNSDVVDPNCEPIARTIRRKLAPKSGNQLFVS